MKTRRAVPCPITVDAITTSGVVVYARCAACRARRPALVVEGFPFTATLGIAVCRPCARALAARLAIALYPDAAVEPYDLAPGVRPEKSYDL